MTTDQSARLQLSKSGLGRLHDSMAAHVGPGQLPGMMTLVASGDDVHIDAIGTPSFDDDTPLARDAILRIASLTKPIAAVAALSLVEEGRLRLEDPIDELVPELANRRVLRAIDADLDDTVPANRPITVEDLLSYRLGFGSVMAPPGSYPIQREEDKLGLQSIGGPPWPPVTHDVDGWIGALGSLPLLYQPGEQWLYNTSGQVLGVLLARACGQDLDRCSASGPRAPRNGGHRFHRPRRPTGPAHHPVRARSRDRRALGTRRSRPQLVGHADLIPGCQRVARLHYGRLLVVRLDAVGRGHRAG